VHLFHKPNAESVHLDVLHRRDETGGAKYVRPSILPLPHQFIVTVRPGEFIERGGPLDLQRVEHGPNRKVRRQLDRLQGHPAVAEHLEGALVRRFVLVVALEGRGHVPNPQVRRIG